MPINPEDFKDALENETTEAIVNLINLCVKELSSEERVVPANDPVEEMRGGIRPTRPTL